ncbi:MAG: ferredoxin family protein [Phycisphaerae bacterium]|nr:ferredoxin family protein [Phycisphaerae bacterium]
MTHIVTGRCVDCRYTDCCAVCPVDCFYETTNPAMLVIDPDTCIDCGLCIPECPIHAIYPQDEVPEPYREWIDKNKELFSAGTNITSKKDALPGALSLEQIQQKEKSMGWDISEPTGA